MSYCQKCGKATDGQPLCNDCGEQANTEQSTPDNPPTTPTPPPDITAPLPNAPYSQPGEPIYPQKTNSFAIASLIFGIFAITGLFGFICGIIALRQIGDERGATRGRSIALSGLVVSILWPVILAVIIFPLFSNTHHKTRQPICMSNQKQIALQVNLYAQENEESLPASADTWRSEIGLNGSKVMVCENESGPISYGFNASLLGSSLGAVKNACVDVILTADSRVDAMATFADFVPRHSGGTIVSFLDGHVEYLKSSTVFVDPNVNDSAGAPNIYVLEGASSIYSFDGTTMLGSPVTLSGTAGDAVYFAISIGEYYDDKVQNAVGGKTITTGLLALAVAEKVTLSAVIGNNRASYYIYAVTMPPGYSKMNIVPSGNLLAISFKK